MDRLTRPLFSPDSANQSGTAPAATAAPASATPTADASASSSANQATGAGTQQPAAGRTVSEQDWQNLQREVGKAREADKFFGRLKSSGIEVKSFDELVPQLSAVQRMRSDPTLGRIVDALNEPAQQPSGGVTSDPNQPLTHQQALELAGRTVDERIAAYESRRFQQEHASASTIEKSLIGEMISADQRLKPIFGEHSFDDAYNGKAGDAAQMLAVLIDNEFALSASPYADGPLKGRLQPVTDRAKAAQVRDSVFKKINALKAAVAFDASSNLRLTEPLSAGHVDEKSNLSPHELAERRRENLNQEAASVYMSELARLGISAAG
jgi:hypothetical protein